MTRRFLDYAANNVGEISDLIAVDGNDTWPQDYQRDRGYLYDAIIELKRKSEAVQLTVCRVIKGSTFTLC